MNISNLEIKLKTQVDWVSEIQFYSAFAKCETYLTFDTFNCLITLSQSALYIHKYIYMNCTVLAFLISVYWIYIRTIMTTLKFLSNRSLDFLAIRS